MWRKKYPPRTGDIGGLSSSQGHNILQNKEENTPNPSENLFLLREKEGGGERGGVAISPLKITKIIKSNITEHNIFKKREEMKV